MTTSILHLYKKPYNSFISLNPILDSVLGVHLFFDIGPQDIGARISADISAQAVSLSTAVSTDIITQNTALITSISTDLSVQGESLAASISTQLLSRHVI